MEEIKPDKEGIAITHVLRIPSSFTLFASEIRVVFNNALMNSKNQYGESDYSKQEIILAYTAGVDRLPEGRIKDCFYHEKVHMILNQMKEDDLSNNEKFVDTFAKLLRQSEETAKYEYHYDPNERKT